MSDADDELPYGNGDASYQAAGGYDGIKALVDDFYDAMEALPEAKTILVMHTGLMQDNSLSDSRKKLTYFLSGWLGGPKLFSEHFYPIRIPMAHKHLSIGAPERDAWLLCMQTALKKQPYDPAFKEYLMEQLWVPAERIRQVSGTSEWVSPHIT